MFFTNFLRTKLVSYLRPWLDEDPDVELKLGFLRSDVSLKNISFNSSALNPLIKKSTTLAFKRVKFGELSIRISPWSFPSLVLDVRGVDVTLVPRESVDDCIVRTDFAARKKKEVIAALDPQGASLHDIVERTLVRYSSGNRLMTALANAMLRCCQVQFSDICVLFQFIDESYACMLRVDDFSLKPQFLNQNSLFICLIGSLHTSSKKAALALSSGCAEFVLRGDDRVSWKSSLMHMSAVVKLNNLLPSDCLVRIPDVKVKISPEVIPIFLVLMDVISFKELESHRSGQELWKIAAERTVPLSLASKPSIYKVVNIILLWLRYVHAYESLLLITEFHGNKTLKENLCMVSNDSKRLSLVQHHWGSVCQLEEKLPAEAVASARKVARQRAFSHLKQIDLKSNTGLMTSLFSDFVVVLSPFWKFICFIFLSALQFFVWGSASGAHQGVNSLPIPGGAEVHCSLILGEVQITLSHLSTDPGIIFGKTGDGANTPDMTFTTLCCIITCVCLDYTTDIDVTSLFVALGELKLSLSSLIRDPLGRSGERGKRTFNGSKGKTSDEYCMILWCDPALPCHPLANALTVPSDTVASALDSTLENSIRDLWLNWTKASRKYEEMKANEQPFALCELKNSLIDPCMKEGECGRCECSLALGKLNCDLTQSSMLSTALLIKQMLSYHQFATSVVRTRAHSHSLDDVVESFQNREARLQNYIHRMKVAMFNMIPCTNLQIGALIGGPNIRISLQDKLIDASEQVSHPLAAKGIYHCFFILDIEAIEFTVCPASKAGLAPLTRQSSFDDFTSQYIWTKEPRKVGISKPHTNETLFFQERTALDVSLRFKGLSVIVDDLEVSQHSPILKPMSIIVNCSSCRDHLHSLIAPVSILSMALSVFTTGAAVFLYMDEMWTFFQIFEGILSVVLSTFDSFESATVGYSQDFIRKLTSLARKNTERNMLGSDVIARHMAVNTQILFDAIVEFKEMDIFLNDYRRKHSRGTSMNSDGASSSNTTHLVVMPAGKKSNTLEMPDFPGSGIGFFVKRSCVKISGERNHLDVIMDFSGIQFVIFDCQRMPEVCIEPAVISQMKDLLEQYSKCLYELNLCNCNLSIHIGSDGSILRITGADHELQVCHLLTTRSPETASDCWIFVEIQLEAISLSSYCMKRSAGKCLSNDLKISFHICKEFHAVNCNIQGGDVFLECLALSMFAHYFLAYFVLISKHPLLLLNDGRKSFGENQLTGKPNNLSLGDYVVGSSPAASPSKAVTASNWVFLQDFTVHLSQFSIILAGKDGAEGEIQDLMLEVDLRLKWLTSGRKLLFDLERLAIFSQNQHKCVSHKSKDTQMPHFRSSNALPLQLRSDNDNFPSQKAESVLVGLNIQSKISSLFSTDDLAAKDVSKNHIVKHMTASIMIEKAHSVDEASCVVLNSDWVGTGSISGVDVTVTLHEIQVISSLLEALSGVSGGKGSPERKRSFDFSSQEGNSDPGFTIPEGAIVAIKDVHEHMYFAVEAENNQYCVVGVLHYTLASERAFFRVKYHRGWRSQITGFSLLSLFAKDKHGEPLCLNSSPGSGFVKISSSEDKRQALWQTCPYKCRSLDDDDDVNSYSVSMRKAFHLVNQKNSCAVAFVEGLPEFVKKPGHPFKAKVLNGFSLTNDQRLNISNDNSIIICDGGETQEGTSQVREVSRSGSTAPCVNITIDKVTLTIFHEISDSHGKIPIVRGSINDFGIVGQIISSKVRVISSFSITIQYMDAQRNFWKDVVSPVGSSLFFQSRPAFLNAGHVHHGVPTHIFFSMREINIFLTEISVDVLLYLIGKLNIAGPYAVRTSTIFPNCCKLENHSGLDLLCHFPGKQHARLAGKQSASIFLRHISDVDHLPESESTVSVSLSWQGTFSTSPFNVSLSKHCFFASRTRITSFQDSRSFPGPVIIVEVSQKSEEGLYLGVSPLVRISNESGLSMELRFRRVHETEGECATILLKDGDTIDDSMAVFDALQLSGGSKRTLMSLTLGNFLLSVRAEIPQNLGSNGESILVEWSEDLQGGKAFCMPGIFDKLNYRFRKAFGVESVKPLFSTLHCPLLVEGRHLSELHFLVQTIGRDVPLMQPPNVSDASAAGTSPVALQMQKEIFLYPTVQVYNLLQSEIFVHVTENNPDMTEYCNCIGKQATIGYGSSTFLYANPAIMYFTVTLNAYNSKCTPVNSADWVKELHKQKNKVHYVDTELDFGGGKYALLRVSRAEKGFLEVTVFSSYTFQNNTEFPVLCYASNHKPLSWDEIQKHTSDLSPGLGCLLAPNATASWFLKSTKVYIKQLEEKASASLLDLEVLSGFTEICLEAHDEFGFSRMMTLGVSIKPCAEKAHLPSQVVCIVPRYVIANESDEPVFFRQCYLQDDFGTITSVEAKQKVALEIRKKTNKVHNTSILHSVLKKHMNSNGNSQVFIQFCLREVGYCWSGPICVASLGRFFLKFKRSLGDLSDESNSTMLKDERSTRFAVIQVVEESSSLGLHFYLPANVALPYRIENCLRGSSILYQQKDCVESDMLGSGNSVEYVWDDLNLPHKLVVQVADLHLMRERNIDKICSWRPLFKMRQQKVMIMHLPLDKQFGMGRRTEEAHGLEMFKVGYEVYADGPTRVLRICEGADSYKEEKVLQSCKGFKFRVSTFSLHLLEENEQNVNASRLPTIIAVRLVDIALDSLITDRVKHYCIEVQSMNVDEKWLGAPFASMVRRSQTHDFGFNENILHIAFILHSSNLNVKEVKYFSFILQPIDLKVDEETLMRLVSFWRTSLSSSRTPSQQFYFKHFEIHPIKITASFLPGNPYSRYSSAQETLRSLLHSVIKVPAVNNKVVELNGILLTHAYVTFRELLIKCAQHYSWYAVRAIYMAKGSQLLPPAFASIFDDTASSSLDVFFDPSDRQISLSGITLGMFKFISKCIDSKGLSGTQRYFGDLGKTLRIAGSNALFAAVTEISDSMLKGAEASGFNGMVTGFHQGILRLAMEPSLLGAAVLEGGPDRKIKLDRSPGVDELYIEGYLQAMLDVMYKQEYLRVRVIDNQVILKNLPPNSSVINEIVENVKCFLVSKALLKGDTSTASRPLRHLRTENDWRMGPIVLTLCEHLFVSFTIRILRKHANGFTFGSGWKWNNRNEGKASSDETPSKSNRKWAIGRFIFSGLIAYLDGRLCRHIPNPIARRIVSGFLLSYLDSKDGQ